MSDKAMTFDEWWESIKEFSGDEITHNSIVVWKAAFKQAAEMCDPEDWDYEMEWPVEVFRDKFITLGYDGDGIKYLDNFLDYAKKSKKEAYIMYILKGLGYYSPHYIEETFQTIKDSPKEAVLLLLNGNEREGLPARLGYWYNHS